MRIAVLRYRVMAYITGVLIIIVVFAGIPLQFLAHNTIISDQVGTVHGFLYLVYIAMALMLSMRLRLRPRPTVLLLVAGTVPVMTFVVERWITHRYIEPALAAESAQPTLSEAAGAPPGGQAKAPGRRLGQWLHGA